MSDQTRDLSQRAPFLTVVPAGSAAAPSASDVPFHEQPYSPMHLLSLLWVPSSLVGNADFFAACEFGFNDYFDPMIECIAECGTAALESGFMHKKYTRAAVLARVGDALFLREQERATVSFAFSVGFIFGWLSALSQYQPRVAKDGLERLRECLARPTAHKPVNAVPMFFAEPRPMGGFCAISTARDFTRTLACHPLTGKLLVFATRQAATRYCRLLNAQVGAHE